MLLHPEVALRDCADCQRHVYDEATGLRAEFPPRSGKPVPRPPGAPPPCRLRAGGCPKGSPEDSRALSARNLRAYAHYLECRAVGRFPDDAVVRRNAAIMHQVEQECARILYDQQPR